MLRRETAGGWADMPEELVAKVLDLLQAANGRDLDERARGGHTEGFCFSKTSATVRLVCAAWKAVHDALVKRLLLTRQTTDEAMGMLVLRFPAVESLEMNDTQRRCWTDEGMRAVIK